MTETFTPEGTRIDPQPNKRAAEVQATRRRRADTSENAGLKLHIPESAKDPNYVYRFINDKPGRIHAKTVQDDWDIVNRGDLKGDPDPRKEAGQVANMVGVTEGGQPMQAYLCRKPKHLFEEDKGKEQSRIKAREESIRKGESQSSEGLSGPTAYVPGGVNANTISHGR